MILVNSNGSETSPSGNTRKHVQKEKIRNVPVPEGSKSGFGRDLDLVNEMQ